MNMSMHVYISAHTYMCVYIYIYIYVSLSDPTFVSNAFEKSTCLAFCALPLKPRGGESVELRFETGRGAVVAVCWVVSGRLLKPALLRRFWSGRSGTALLPRL